MLVECRAGGGEFCVVRSAGIGRLMRETDMCMYSFVVSFRGWGSKVFPDVFFCSHVFLAWAVWSLISSSCFRRFLFEGIAESWR